VDTLNATSGGFDYNPFLSNRFIYKENINAAYTNYQHQFGNFGCRWVCGWRIRISAPRLPTA